MLVAYNKRLYFRSLATIANFGEGVIEVVLLSTQRACAAGLGGRAGARRATSAHGPEEEQQNFHQAFSEVPYSILPRPPWAQ